MYLMYLMPEMFFFLFNAFEVFFDIIFIIFDGLWVEVKVRYSPKQFFLASILK
jgi:hypothetical protein